MRKAINNLQSLAMSFNIINAENVSNFFGYPTQINIDNIYNITQKNKLKQAHVIIKDNINDNQYSILELISEFNEYLLNRFLNDKISLDKYTEIILKLKSIEKNIYLCPPDDLCISAFISCFYV